MFKLKFNVILIIFHYMEIISNLLYMNNFIAPWTATQCSIQTSYLLPHQRIAQAGIIEHRTAPTSPLRRYTPGLEEVDDA